MNGAAYLIRFLKNKNVDTVFGYPGATLLQVYEELEHSGIRHILMRHEQGCIHAACGYAKASGRVGVCLATSGPGATNLVTGIADASLDSVPLLVVTGQVMSDHIGRDAFQEADIMGITIPVTKHNFLVKTPDRLAKCLEEGWNIADSGRKGPVLVDITRDVFECDFNHSPPLKIAYPRPRANSFLLSSAFSDLKREWESARRPILLAGGGVIGGSGEEDMYSFLRASGIPLVTTLMCKGIVPPSGVDYLGMVGMFGDMRANRALDAADLVIASGIRFSDRTIPDFQDFSRRHRVFHNDIDQAEIGKNVRADGAAVCDSGVFFRALIEEDFPASFCNRGGWENQLPPVEKGRYIPPSDRLSCREILESINRIGKKRGGQIYVTDVGNHQMSAALELENLVKRGFITSGGLGVMGFCLPAAIGASLVDRQEDRIVALCGDGGFQMTLQETASLRYAGKPIKLFVFDNGELGMIEKMQKRKFGKSGFASTLDGNPDFCLLAEAYGIASIRLDVSSRMHLDEKIGSILEEDGHVLVHCVTSEKTEENGF